MKQYRFLFFLMAVLVLAVLACNGGSAPTSAPQNEPPVVEQPDNNPPPDDNNNLPTEVPQSGGSSDIVTFVDENSLFAFDLPGNWTHTNSFNDQDGVFVDRFESPDGMGFMENLTGFSKEPLTGRINGKLALYFLHKYYSTTGAQGDIRISDDNIQPDGSERLKWKSKSGGYTGISYFEVRGEDRLTFLMLTVWWNDSADQATLDIITSAVESYRIP